MWLGTIESEDGAFQLIQILEFIRSWARDIFRPSIQESYENLNLRGLTPSSASIARSESIFSIRSLPLQLPATSSNHGESYESDLNMQALENGGNHPLLQWARDYRPSADWASQVNIQHVNVVLYSFNILPLPNVKQVLKNLANSLPNENQQKSALSHLTSLLQHPQYFIQLTKSQLQAIRCEWTGTKKISAANPSADSNEVFTVSIFFRCFVQGRDWQIRREIHCMAVPSQILDLRNQPSSFQFMTILQSIQRVRDLSGSESLQYAVNDVSFLLDLETGLAQWIAAPAEGREISINAIALCAGFHKVAKKAEGDLNTGSLRWIRQHRNEASVADPLPKAFKSLDNEGGSVLVRRPDASSQSVPRFCLYILEDTPHVDSDRVQQWLRNSTHHFQEIHANADAVLTFSQNDSRIIQSWLASLRTGHTGI